MRVLITGAAGYIGSHATRSCLDAGFQVVALDNLSTGEASLIPDGTPLYEGDAGDGSFVKEIIERHEIEAVMHFAGSVVVPESVSNPLKYYANNTVTSRNLIQTCIETAVRRFVFSSTAAVYGVPTESPISETAATVPINPYGSSKLMTETMLRDTAAAHDFSYLALRYFNVAGADPQGRCGQCSPDATHLIKVASQVAAGTRPGMQVFGDDYDTPDGTCVRDYIHVTDLADAHVAALRYLSGGGGNKILNCGYGRGYSVREVIDAVEKEVGTALNVTVAPRRAGDPPALVADNTQILEALNWAPKHDDLGTIVHTALAWERQLVARQPASTA